MFWPFGVCFKSTYRSNNVFDSLQQLLAVELVETFLRRVREGTRGVVWNHEVFHKHNWWSRSTVTEHDLKTWEKAKKETRKGQESINQGHLMTSKKTTAARNANEKRTKNG